VKSGSLCRLSIYLQFVKMISGTDGPFPPWDFSLSPRRGSTEAGVLWSSEFSMTLSLHRPREMRKDKGGGPGPAAQNGRFYTLFALRLDF
jgi:hypothetical protein